jgi:hypothetical protein
MEAEKTEVVEIPYKWESLILQCRRCKKRYLELFPLGESPVCVVCFPCFMELTFCEVEKGQ